MKRSQRQWPKEIVEVAAKRHDPRSEDAPSDPQATQKISREQLEAVLAGTKSGFRPAVRAKRDAQPDLQPDPQPDLQPGPEASMTPSIATPGMLPVSSFEPLAQIVVQAETQELGTTDDAAVSQPLRLPGLTRLPLAARVVVLGVSAALIVIAVAELVRFVGR